MYCQECGKQSQPGEVICSSCGGALTDAELDLPEVAAYPINPLAESADNPQAVQVEAPASPRMPIAPSMFEPPTRPQGQGPRLDATVGSLSGSYPLKPTVTTIGRADPSAGLRPDIDLGMDQAVSRRHAEIRRGPSGYAIIDLGSTNGTIVNGRQVPRQQEVPLSDGDEIRIGETCKLTVRL